MPDLAPPVVPAGRLGERPQPTLTVDGLSLRPWQISDVDHVVQAYSDPAIQRWHVSSVTRTEAVQWIESRQSHWTSERGADWVVAAGDELLGRMGCRSLDLAEGQGEVVYWMLPSARGRGVARRALDGMSRWLFDEVGLHRLELLHSTANSASCRVAGKTGFMLEGTKREAGWHADGWHDMHLHARLASDALDQLRVAPS